MFYRTLLLAFSCALFCCHPASRTLLTRSVIMDPGSGEFARNANGYIYSDAAMTQLHHIVDSLNLRFKSCDLNPKVQALDQARGHYLSGGTPGKLLRAALEQNKSFEDVLALSPGSEPLKNVLIVRETERPRGGEPSVNFYCPAILRDGDTYYRWFTQKPTAGNTTNALNGRWIFNLEKDSWEGFYLTSDFRRTTLPVEYGRMVQYVDCVIDTNAQVLLEKGAWTDTWLVDEKKSTAIKAFVDRTQSHPEWPFPEDSTVWPGEPGYPAYQAALDDWHEKNSRWLRDTFRHSAEYAALLEAALGETESAQISNEAFEEVLVETGQTAKALELKRKRRVIGGCSQDSRPRDHAQAIAELAAETIQWDIFLRAHLDIMNDRFDRMSDGSYAWGRRQTYIGEVEALGINTLDLLLGICLNARNLPGNHYSGDLGRVGRALAEYSRPDELEVLLAGMIADSRLDDYNRLWMYNLYCVYASYLPEDSERKKVVDERLKASAHTLPPYLAEKL